MFKHQIHNLKIQIIFILQESHIQIHIELLKSKFKIVMKTKICDPIR